MSSISQRLTENKNIATKYLLVMVDGMESEASPLKYLKDNDAIVDYICYLSLPPWKKEEFKKSDKVVKLPGAADDK